MRHDSDLKLWHIPFGMLVALVVLALMMCACKSVEYVPVVENHSVHHWHTDSVRQRDSIYTEHTTIIRELDSAAMARYGIELKAAERAWLVQNREMEARLRELERMTAERDTVHDSIPVPYPVPAGEPQDTLTWWQQTRLYLGDGVIFLVLGGIVVMLVRRRFF